MDAIENEDYAKGAALVREAMGREPNNPHLVYFLTQALKEVDPSAAIDVLGEIAEGSGPYKPAAQNDLAYLLSKHRTDELDRAYELAKAVHATNPTNPALLDTLGWIEHLRGNQTAALGHLNNAVTRLSDVPQVHFHLALVYRAMGNERWMRYHLTQAAAGPEGLPEANEAREMLASVGG